MSVHFKLRDKKASAVCRALVSPGPELSAVPRYVSCSACLDWIASNHKTVVDQVSDIISDTRTRGHA